tara:strand:+ start:271 stop:882 length:612 start_codon:yes stop_codon:yes gene_type:complete
MIIKTRSKQLSILRSKKIYNKDGAKQLSNYDKLEIYNYHKNFFQQKLKDSEEKTILDFGCGTGRYLEIQKNFKKVYLVDISKHNLSIASKIADELNINHSVIKKSLFGLNKKVDCFFSVGVFGQQYPFDKKVVKKIYSLLKKDGLGIFSIKTVDEYSIEPLSLDQDAIINILKPYKHKTEIQNFIGVNGRSESFLIVSLYRDS